MSPDAGRNELHLDNKKGTVMFLPFDASDEVIGRLETLSSDNNCVPYKAYRSYLLLRTLYAVLLEWCFGLP